MTILNWILFPIICAGIWCIQFNAFSKATRVLGAAAVLTVVICYVTLQSLSQGIPQNHRIHPVDSLTPIFIANLAGGLFCHRISIQTLFRIQALASLIVFEFIEGKYFAAVVSNHRPLIDLVEYHDAPSGIAFECYVGVAWMTSFLVLQSSQKRKLSIAKSFALIVLTTFPYPFVYFLAFEDLLLLYGFLFAPCNLVMVLSCVGSRIGVGAEKDHSVASLPDGASHE